MPAHRRSSPATARPETRTSRPKSANGRSAPRAVTPDVKCNPSVAANGRSSWFTAFAQKTADIAGRPSAFMLAAAVIVVWGVSGPIFGYSDTWQLVINTGTTIVTFLMVFLIQHTQNRDAIAFQVKLDELIIAMQGASNEVAAAEDLCDEDLKALHAAYRKRAAETLDTLEDRHIRREAK